MGGLTIMSERFEKEELNTVTHSVRAAQAVLQYGVGAMVDFQEQTLVTSSPEYWNGTAHIFDDRFAKALNVDYFALPTHISYVRFPEWYFCPKCRKFQPLSQWINEYKKKTKPKQLQHDVHMVEHMQCPSCKQDLVVSRIVTICEKGHLNDFPWIKWVHSRAKRQVCGHPELKFKTTASSTEGVEGLTIECSCGARATLKNAFDKDIFKKMDNNGENSDFICDGNHPFKHIKEYCECYPRTVQRGASSVYFPIVYSSLVIPPYSDKLNTKIEKSKAYEECIVIIDDEEPEDRMNTIKKRFPKWASKIATEIGARQNDVEKILQKKWLENTDNEVDATSVQYRFEEYMALTGEISTTSQSTLGDFSMQNLSADLYDFPHIKSISLVDKIRVVHALTGFSRVTAVTNSNDIGFVSVKKPETRWYPAYEVRGEGIFIEFNSDQIQEWINNNPLVVSRADRLNENYARSFIGSNHPRQITPKFIMLHTLSHLLISQLSFECGYSIASLSERIYCSEASEGKTMSGILIYTANGDSEGTLGGLVRQGKPDALTRIIKKAINSAKVCSNDPVCSMSHGQGKDSLNLAACHSCALLPETCCEEKNVFLDRGMIVGTLQHPEIGFWRDL